MTTSPAPSLEHRDAEAVPFDAHGIEPIPDRARDSTPIEHFWIWFGANLAPINGFWALSESSWA